jgi:hypothetical protein
MKVMWGAWNVLISEDDKGKKEYKTPEKVTEKEET